MKQTSPLARISRLLALFFCLAIFLPLSARATEKVDLNGDWRFRIDPKSEGETAGWSKTAPDGTEIVRVPHTWNIGKYDDYEGIAWYFRNFEFPALPLRNMWNFISPQRFINRTYG